MREQVTPDTYSHAAHWTSEKNVAISGENLHEIGLNSCVELNKEQSKQIMIKLYTSLREAKEHTDVICNF